MHYNENSSRRQKITKIGKKCWKIVYPKYKPGQPVIKAVLEDATYGYVDECFTAIMERAQTNKKQRVVERPQQPPPLTSKYASNKKSKDQLLSEKFTRFNKV